MRVRLFLLAVLRVILEMRSLPQVGQRIPSGQRCFSRNSSASSSVLNVLVTSIRFIQLPLTELTVHQLCFCVKRIIVCFSLLTCKNYRPKCDSSCTTIEKWLESGILERVKWLILGTSAGTGRGKSDSTEKKKQVPPLARRGRLARDDKRKGMTNVGRKRQSRWGTA